MGYLLYHMASRLGDDGQLLNQCRQIYVRLCLKLMIKCVYLQYTWFYLCANLASYREKCIFFSIESSVL